MRDPMLKLQILVRSELTLAQINARRTAARSVYFAIALVFLLLGLAMMTISAYQALVPLLGEAWAAFCVAMIDTIVGLLFILIARRAGPSMGEEKLAREIRDTAYAELNKDVEEFKGQIEEVGADVKRIRSSFTSFTHGAIGGLGPILNLLTRALKRD